MAILNLLIGNRFWSLGDLRRKLRRKLALNNSICDKIQIGDGYLDTIWKRKWPNILITFIFRSNFFQSFLTKIIIIKNHIFFQTADLSSWWGRCRTGGIGLLSLSAGSFVSIFDDGTYSWRTSFSGKFRTRFKGISPHHWARLKFWINMVFGIGPLGGIGTISKSNNVILACYNCSWPWNLLPRDTRKSILWHPLYRGSV